VPDSSTSNRAGAAESAGSLPHDWPEVTAVIINYNGENYLRPALDSILSQTRPPVRVLVVDDASTDGSLEVIRQYVERDARVELLQLPNNSGPAVARNTGLQAADTELVAFLDGDDIWLPGHLETVVPLVANNPEVALGFSLVRTFGNQDRIWDADLPADVVVDAFWPSVARCVAQTSAVVARRDMLLEIGGYTSDLLHCQDFDLYMRLARRHPFISSHKVTVMYRRHSESVSHKLIESRWSEYTARQRFWEAESTAEHSDPDFLRQLSAHMSKAYEQRFREAWGQRDSVMFAFLPQLATTIPEGEAVAARWRNRGRLIPVARLWDAVPAPIKASLRKLKGAVRR